MERQTRYAPEQIHLFTDREVYAAGDTIWFSGWVLNDQTLKPTTHSRRLYVDLINPDLRIVQDLVLELANGIAYGSFVWKYIFVGFDNNGLLSGVTSIDQLIKESAKLAQEYASGTMTTAVFVGWQVFAPISTFGLTNR